jgi:hypothetical protein
VKFTRHLVAVLLTLAAIVALGVAWEHSAAASWLGDSRSRPGRLVTGAPASPLTGKDQVTAGAAAHFRSVASPDPSDIKDLIRTVLIVAVIMTVVAAIGAVRRRRRRGRRTPPRPLPQ